MKVLHLISSSGVYGAERMLLSLVEAQMKQGLSSMILCTCDVRGKRNELEFEAERLGLSVKVWPVRSGLDLRSCQKLLRWAMEENYQILHTHGYKFTVSLGLLRAFNDYPFRFVATFHGYTYKSPLSRGFLYAMLDRLFRALFFEKTVLVGPSNKKNLFYSMLRNRVIIPNGIPIIESPGKRQRRNHIVAIGRLSPEKNFSLLLHAFRKVAYELSDSFLTIAGEGGQRENLIRLASQLQIADRVEFVGYIKDVGSLLREADVFVNSSLTEGLPITLLEAINFEVPVVATNVGSVSFIFTEGLSYPYLVESGDVEGLSKCIISVLRASGDEIKSLTVAQKTRLTQVFSSESMANEYLCLYRGLGA